MHSKQNGDDKENLFQAIRGHYDFVNAQVFVNSGDDELSKNSNGHWIVVAANFSCDKVYTYDLQ